MRVQMSEDLNLDIQKKIDVYPARAIVSLYYGFKDEAGEEIAIEKNMSRELYAVRVVIIAGWLLIAADSPTGPVLVFSQKTDPSKWKLRTGKGEESYAITESGRLVVFKKDDSCGCGSKLRVWNPIKTVRTLIQEEADVEKAIEKEIADREAE